MHILHTIGNCDILMGLYVAAGIGYSIIRYIKTTRCLDSRSLTSVKNCEEVILTYIKKSLLYSTIIRGLLIMYSKYNISADILASTIFIVFNISMYTGTVRTIISQVDNTTYNGHVHNENHDAYKLTNKLISNSFISALIYLVSILIFVSLCRYEHIRITHVTSKVVSYINGLLFFGKNFVITFSVILILYKALGNTVTKIGDIINDYEAKITSSKGNSDHKNSIFAYIDTIGDIVGDAYGTLVDVLLVTAMCFIGFKRYILDHIQANIVSFCTLKIIMLAFTYLLYSMIFSRKVSNISILNWSFITLMIICAAVDVGLYRYLYGSSVSTKFLLNSIFCILSLLFILICNALSYFKVYKQLSTRIKNMVDEIDILGFTLVILFSILASWGVINITNICYHAVKKIGIINTTRPTLYAICLNNIILLSFFILLRTIIGASSDSACNICENIQHNNNKCDFSDKTKSDNITNKYYIGHKNDVEILDSIDSEGNVFKMESKIFSCIVLYALHYRESCNIITKLDLFNPTICLLSLAFLYTIHDLKLDLKYLAKHSTDQIICNILASVCFLFSPSIVYIVNSFDFIRLEQCFITMIKPAITLCIIASIAGGLFDITKKYYEKENISDKTMASLVKYDLFGDYAKDFLAPTSYSIALVFAVMSAVSSNLI